MSDLPQVEISLHSDGRITLLSSEYSPDEFPLQIDLDETAQEHLKAVLVVAEELREHDGGSFQ